jgi:hypothetical protein
MAENGDSKKLIDSDRKTFLLKMYDQMFADINRHIMVVWQSIGVLLGAVALFTLVEKQIISLDVACSVFTVVVGWSIGHSQEAGYWYNRNLAIIANIERQFLRESDLREVHYYFGAHRPKNKLLDQLVLQISMAAVIGLIFLGYHFQVRVIPGFSAPFSNFDWQRALPYVVASAIFWWLCWNWVRLGRKYAEFLEISPGIQIDTTGIRYGVGHGGSQPLRTKIEGTPKVG